MFGKMGGWIFAVVAMLLSALARAEVPTDVTTAIGATKTDSLSVAGLMLGIVAALLTFKYIRRLMK